MIQRIQSLYLLLSTILGIVCLCMPLGNFTLQGVHFATLHNLWTNIDAERVYSNWALFVILLLATLITFMAIFLYKTRAFQMRTAVLAIVLIIGWYAYLAFTGYTTEEGLSFRPTIWAAFPFAMVVLNYLAFRGIMRDEMLVRSLDRLR